jgi:hypothetical protein
LPAQTGRPVIIQSYQNAKELRDLCREYIAGMDAIRKIEKPTADPVKGAACIGYIKGAVDGLNLAIHNLAASGMASGAVPKSFNACVPVVNVEELARIFLKYIDSHPGELSNMAADVVWRAMIASYPCPAK